MRDTVFQDTNTGQRPVSQQRNELEESLGPAVGPPRPKPEGEDEELKREYEAWKIKKDKKDYKKHKELVEEELVPKKTGREATMEKKKMKVSSFNKHNYCAFVSRRKLIAAILLCYKYRPSIPNLKKQMM